MNRPAPSIGRDLIERVGNAAFLADRRPHTLPVALNGIGDITRRLVSLPGPEARELRDAGECLAALLGAARIAQQHARFAARDAALAEMARVAVRVATIERLAGLPAPPPAPITVALPQQPFGRSAMATLHRLVNPEPRAAARPSLTLIPGGRA